MFCIKAILFPTNCFFELFFVDLTLRLPYTFRHKENFLNGGRRDLPSVAESSETMM